MVCLNYISAVTKSARTLQSLAYILPCVNSAGCWRREEPFLCTHCVSATGVVCMSASTASIVTRSPSKKGSSVCSGSGDLRHCALQITNLQHLASCCVYMEQNLEGSFDFQNSLYCKVSLTRMEVFSWYLLQNNKETKK